MGFSVERSRAVLYRQIKNEVSRLCGDARTRPILIVDEAHHLRPDVLEDLRLLTNYQMDAEPRLCLLLLGQTELRRRLTMAMHEALAQRIVVRYHMAALTREELTGYLSASPPPGQRRGPSSPPPPEKRIYHATGGLPRKINLLAHHTLLAAALTRAKLATADHVQAAAARSRLTRPTNPGPRSRPSADRPGTLRRERTNPRIARPRVSKKREKPSVD